MSDDRGRGCRLIEEEASSSPSRSRPAPGDPRLGWRGFRSLLVEVLGRLARPAPPGLGQTSREKPEAAWAALRGDHEASARPDPTRVHPSWFVRALAAESPAVRLAVAAHAPGPVGEALRRGLGLDPSDLATDRSPDPEAIGWALALWSERLVGDVPGLDSDPPVVVALTRLRPRELARLVKVVRTGQARLRDRRERAERVRRVDRPIHPDRPRPDRLLPPPHRRGRPEARPPGQARPSGDRRRPPTRFRPVGPGHVRAVARSRSNRTGLAGRCSTSLIRSPG